MKDINYHVVSKESGVENWVFRDVTCIEYEEERGDNLRDFSPERALGGVRSFYTKTEIVVGKEGSDDVGEPIRQVKFKQLVKQVKQVVPDFVERFGEVEQEDTSVADSTTVTR